MGNNAVTAPRETNGLAIAGFVIAIVGLFTSGILCPVGLIISLVALGREPKGFAIAGVIVGLIGTCGGILVVLFLGGLILAALGLAVAAVALDQAQQSELTSDMVDIAMAIVEYRDDNDVVPPNLATLQLPSEKLVDPWGNTYAYRMLTDDPGFELTSAGADRVFDTGDDVRFSELGERWEPAGITVRGGDDGGQVRISLGPGRSLEVSDEQGVLLRAGDKVIRISGDEHGGHVEVGEEPATADDEASAAETEGDEATSAAEEDGA
jgi:hypothetical protein